MFRPFMTITQGVALGYHVTGFQPSLGHGFCYGGVVEHLCKLFSTRETRKHEGRQAVPKLRKLPALMFSKRMK
jgi:hypothetical protein